MINLILMLFLSQVPYPLPPMGEGFKSGEWSPYDFKGTEYFKYEVKGVEEGKIKKGYEIIDIKKSGDKYKLKIEGKYGESEGTFTLTLDNREDIPGAIISQVMFNPYLAPLAISLFSPAWTFYFTLAGISFEEGSKWKTKDEEGNVTEMEVTGSETYAGKKGKKLIVKENGKETWVIVWAKDVALPLYIKMGKEGESTYELKLIEYKE